ncbi:MAG: GHMP kinase [Acidobacteriia bacterium]|nr:GHMP kinase [Terriglobia bacterium]
MQIQSKSPCRVDMAGGTLDIWPLYLYHPGAVTVNFAVNRYTSCELRTREDGRVVLRSRDQKAGESFRSLDHLLRTEQYKLPLLAWLVRFFRPGMGLELDTHSEAPAGAGIAGSSSLIITVAHAFNRLLGTGYSTERLREICQNVESQIIRVPTGAQDYYPAMYGGVSAIELTAAGVRRRAIGVDVGEFNSRVVLCYTGEPRNSGINNWEVMKAHINGDKKVHRNFEQISAIAQAMRGALEKADWAEVGRLLREEWAHRKRNVPTISTELIDRLVAATRKAGARGAKVCGAGGGGCVFFLVEPETKKRVEEVIEGEGAQVLPVEVARQGVKVRVSEPGMGPPIQ